MKTNVLNDPRLPGAVLGEQKRRRPRIGESNYKMSIEYRIIQKKKELGLPPTPPRYHVFLFGEWMPIRTEVYFEYLKKNENLPEHMRFRLKLL